MKNSILTEIKIFIKQLFCSHRYMKVSVNEKYSCCSRCRKYFINFN